MFSLQVQFIQKFSLNASPFLGIVQNICSEKFRKIHRRRPSPAVLQKKDSIKLFFYDEKIDCKWVKMTVCVDDRISSQQNDVLIKIVDDTANINIMVDEIA